VRFDELTDRLRADERHIAAEDDNGRVAIYLVCSGTHGASGAVGLWLYGKLHPVGQYVQQSARRRVDYYDTGRTGGEGGSHRP
jgi:hypothetical protein